MHTTPGQHLAGKHQQQKSVKHVNSFFVYCTFFAIFFAKLKFSIILFFRKNPSLADQSCGYAGGSPPGRVVENTRQDPIPSAGLFRKISFSKKILRYRPPIFFNFGQPEPPSKNILIN